MKTLPLHIVLVLLNYAQVFSQPAYAIYGSTDRTFYFSGQEVLVSVNSVSSDKIDKELIYIQLLDNGNNIVSHRKAFLRDGVTSISIPLSDNLTTNNYTVIAFTNRSLNYSENTKLILSITVFNFEEYYSGEASVMQSSNLVELFPESGQLLSNFSNRIVYRSHHYCSHDSLMLIDQDKNVLSSFRLNAPIGSFYLVPKSNSKQYLELYCRDALLSENLLPNAVEKGLNFTLSQKKDKVLVLLQHSGTSPDDKITIEGIGNSLFYKASGYLNKKGLIFEISKQEIPKSKVTFIIRGGDNKVITKRKADFTSYSKEQITTSQKLTETRTSVQIQASNFGSATAKVLPLEWVQSHYAARNLEYLFSNNPEDRWAQLADDLSIIETFGIEVNSPKSNGFLTESYLYLNGKFHDSAPLPFSSEIFFFVPGLNLIYETKIDSTGAFKFPLLFEFYDEKSIPFYAYSENHIFENPRIEVIIPKLSLSNPVSETIQWGSVEETAFDELKLAREISEKVDFYLSPKKSILRQDAFDLEALVSSVDEEYDIDSYVEFTDMQELTKEILSSIILRKRNKEYSLRIFSPDQRKTFDQSPFIFIDGQPTRDIQRFLNIDPSVTSKIRVVRSYDKLNRLGPFGNGGLIIVDSKSKKLNSDTMSNLLSFKAMGISTSKEIIAPETSNLPDLRQILHFSSTVSTDSKVFEGEFKTSDRPGKYRIIYKSIGDDGNIKFGFETIEVKFKPKK